MSQIEIRVPTADEFPAFARAVETAFGEEARDSDIELWRRIAEPERQLLACEDGTAVGTASAVSFRLTVPGGELSAAGVTTVGVHPTHRRRGIMTQLMRRQLDDVRELGEPLAILWASESAIYGRFGYGLTTRNARIDVPRQHAVFRDPGQPLGRTRLVGLDAAESVLPPIYERVRRQWPGMLSRTPAWWPVMRLDDREQRRDGGGPLFCAVLAIDGRDEGYALYRLHEGGGDGLSDNRLEVREALATSPVATRELWRYLFGVDLIDRVTARLLAEKHPLFLMVLDPRRLRMSLGDGLWLRLVDVGAALSGRTYAGDGSIVLEVEDAFCDWNAGRWRLAGGEARRTEDDADLRLDVADLASVYLGGFAFADLARALRVEELTPGAIERADVLFRTSQAPWCPEVF